MLQPGRVDCVSLPPQEAARRRALEMSSMPKAVITASIHGALRRDREPSFVLKQLVKMKT